eukprot:4660369-Amphidinium_carterae.1
MELFAWRFASCAIIKAQQDGPTTFNGFRCATMQECGGTGVVRAPPAGSGEGGEWYQAYPR